MPPSRDISDPFLTSEPSMKIAASTFCGTTDIIYLYSPKTKFGVSTIIFCCLRKVVRLELIRRIRLVSQDWLFKNKSTTCLSKEKSTAFVRLLQYNFDKIQKNPVISSWEKFRICFLLICLFVYAVRQTGTIFLVYKINYNIS